MNVPITYCVRRNDLPRASSLGATLAQHARRGVEDGYSLERMAEAHLDLLTAAISARA